MMTDLELGYGKSIHIYTYVLLWPSMLDVTARNIK